ncbi:MULTISPECIES: PilW family protein [unclassified Nocardioides]|uniref:PilW family protein n=1 Tax=unclassified Nocardioides TaxID=2615069 RepID=UPI0036199E84
MKRDAGVSMVEVLVGMVLFGVLSTLLLGLAISTNAVTEDTRDRAGVAEEARTAMERLTRELRQAAAIDQVTLPATPGGGATAFTFWADFDGDGHRSSSAADPEVLTYCWNPDTDRLTLGAQSDCDAAQPVLAAKVTDLVLDFDSSQWAYDTDGDGVTTWRELDARGAPVGNGDGVANAPELAHVDLLGVTMTVEDGAGTQTYHTRIDLRNRS